MDQSARSVRQSQTFSVSADKRVRSHRGEQAVGLTEAAAFRAQFPWIEKVCAFIEANLDRTLTIDELANAAGMAKFTFCRQFKTVHGISPHQYVMGRRIQSACTLIDAGILSLAAIAYDCGFASQSHMNDVFRSKVGISPGLLRKSAKARA